MKQDKNFTVRLKAAVENRMKEAGVIKYGIHPAEEYSSIKDKALWTFMESLETITLNDLQGNPKKEDETAETLPHELAAQDTNAMILLKQKQELIERCNGLADALQKIANAPVPANEREYISWFVTAKNMAAGALSELEAKDYVNQLNLLNNEQK
jgi:hypothetical protein